MVSHQSWENIKGYLRACSNIQSWKIIELFQIQENFKQTWQLSAKWSEFSRKNIIGIIGEIWVRSTVS